MMEHTGRRSGQARFVCLEVVERPSPERIVIVSGFGERAEWYRNLQADPRCFISLGRLRRAPARARFMTSQEASAALNRYEHAHPGAWRRLRQVIEKAVGHPVDQLPMAELLLALPPVPPNASGTTGQGRATVPASVRPRPGTCFPAIDVSLPECPHGPARVPLRPRRRL